MANDRKRKILTLDTRVEVLNLLESGKSLRDVAAQFGCGKTQISRIKSEKDSIMTEWQSGGRSDLKYVKKRKTTYEALNNTVWEWFVKARSKNLPISGRLIQVKIVSIFALDVNVVRELTRTATQYKLYPDNIKWINIITV